MEGKNDGEVSLVSHPKESIQDRISQLVGSRSLRKASIDWGLPYSTLNNYFEKKTMPGLNVVDKIANIEGVSLDWLVRGTEPSQTAAAPQTHQQGGNQEKPLEAILKMLNELDYEELESIRRILARKGVELVLTLIDDESRDLLTASSEIKEIVVLLKSLPPVRLREIYDNFAGNECAAPLIEKSVNKAG